MDTLSNVLGLLRPRGGVFLDARFTAPWAVTTWVDIGICAPTLVDRGPVFAFHYILEGSALVRTPTGPALAVKAGEAILLPRNDPHVLGSDPSRVPVPASEFVTIDPATGLAVIRHGGGGAACRLICGYIVVEDLRHPVLATLPPLLTVSLGATAAGGIVEALLTYAAQALVRGEPGSGAVLASLSELLLTEALRQHLLGDPAKLSGWWLALRDPLVGRVLRLLHAEPERDWTVDGLAKAVASSRSTLAERFTRLVGEPVLAYLTRWRMQLAAQRLRETRQSVFEIASDLGYGSQAGFARAFAREFGCPPARWRRTTGGADAEAPFGRGPGIGVQARG